MQTEDHHKSKDGIVSKERWGLEGPARAHIQGSTQLWQRYRRQYTRREIAADAAVSDGPGAPLKNVSGLTEGGVQHCTFILSESFIIHKGRVLSANVWQLQKKGYLPLGDALRGA